MSNTATRRLHVTITGDLLADITTDTLAAEIAGTSWEGSNGVLIPGCPVVQNVAATSHDGGVTVTAEFLAYDHVPGGDYKGDEVTEKFVTDYIMGAGDYWLGAGDTFSPESAQAARR